MHFFYRTRFGVFSIRPAANGRWTLAMDSDALGSYATPESAADDVFVCATGHDTWDAQGSVNEPESLAEWERG